MGLKDSIKTILEKYISQILLILTVVGLSYFGYRMWKDNQDIERKYTNLIGLNEKYEQLNKYTAKLESSYKDQKELYEKSQKEWTEVVQSKDERIKLLSDATYLIGKHVEKQDGPDYYFQTPKATQNYVLNELRLEGSDSPAIGYVLIKSDGKVYKRNYKFEILVKNLQTVDESTGKIKVYSKAFLIQKETSPLAKRVDGYKDWKDTQYELPIVDGVAFIDPTMPDIEKHFVLWAPHVNFGLNLGADSEGLFVRPALNFSVMGYGKTKNDLDWKFIHLGIDSDTKFDKFGAHVMPFSYRPFSSVITNTYIGPSLGVTKDGLNYSLNINLSL